MMMSHSTRSGRTSCTRSIGQAAVADRHDLEVLVREGQLDDLLDGDAVVGQQDLLAHRLKSSTGRRENCGVVKIDRCLPVCQSERLRRSGVRRCGRNGRLGSSRMTSWVEAPGRNTSATPIFFSSGMSCAGMIPPTKTWTPVHALLAQQLEDAPADRQVRAGEDREADRVHVLLRGRGHDLLRALAQAGVDDLHAGVAQRARHDLGPAVVAVEAGLGDQDADLASRRARRTSSSGRPFRRSAAPRIRPRPRAARRTSRPAWRRRATRRGSGT